MAKYMIESPHTEEECTRALDETLAKGSDILAKFDWGCMSGEHTGWAIVDAESESAARNMVPSFVRNKARVVKVDKFTPQQLKSSHQK
jgi:hypothetical protein